MDVFTRRGEENKREGGGKVLRIPCEMLRDVGFPFRWAGDDYGFNDARPGQVRNTGFSESAGCRVECRRVLRLCLFLHPVDGAL